MKMQQKGVQTVAGLSMLRKAVKAAAPGTGAVLSAIQSANFSITAREFTRLIRSCRNTGQWKKALEILQVDMRTAWGGGDTTRYLWCVTISKISRYFEGRAFLPVVGGSRICTCAESAVVGESGELAWLVSVGVGSTWMDGLFLDLVSLKDLLTCPRGEFWGFCG